MKFKFELPEYVSEILNILHDAGYEAYAVGGAVRDLVMGNAPDDYDVTTSALPEQTSAVFSKDYRVIETGIKHGTVTVLSHGHPVEITTYRKDGEYIDFRRPESVTFTPNLKEDLKRRDFTINALAYDGQSTLIDCFGGLNDIKNKVIRCIGNPDARFSEDALRILRSLRFSAKLDFDIDTETADAALKLCELLHKISAERIFAELSKLFSADYPSRISQVLLAYRCIIETALRCNFDDEKYNSAVGEAVLVPDSAGLRFRYFLCRCAENSDELKSVLKGLKVSNWFCDSTLRIYDAMDEAKKVINITAALRLANRFGFDTLSELSLIYEATGDNARLRDYALEIEKYNLCYSLKQLNINGNDILKLVDLKDRRMTGEILEHLLVSVIDKRIENEKTELLAEAQRYVKAQRKM